MADATARHIARASGTRRARRTGMRKQTKTIVPKKLNLQTQTVRELDSRNLEEAAGAYRYTYFSCSYCTSCWQ